MRIALAQFNSTVGDIKNNTAKMQKISAKAYELGADIVVFPELAVCGYPPEDLLLKPHFLNDNRLAVEYLAQHLLQEKVGAGDITVVTGFAQAHQKERFNSLAVLQSGKINKIYRKCILPNYGVFDERRYFSAGSEAAVMNIHGLKIGFTICEDIWHIDSLNDVIGKMPELDILINISASPFHIGKIEQRKQILRRCARSFNCHVAYSNLIGGHDELIFDGRSMFLDSAGQIICQAKEFDEDLLMAQVTKDKNEKVRLKTINTGQAATTEAAIEPSEEIYNALVLGTSDYVNKNGFSRVIIGLSGGIDSSVTAAIAVDALGAKNVVGITMPTKFNSPDTVKDAQILADNLDVEFHTLPIETVLQGFDTLLNKMPGWNKNGIAYENLQARIRGTILMSLSNQYRYLVLATSNKSEAAVGYSTLYGDSAGGFAILKDIPKTMVYELARYINKIHTYNGTQPIPESVIKRQPTAELKENQKDSDSLPPYDILDKILKGYVEQDKSVNQLIEQGLPEEIVNRVINMVDRSEYKRRQSPPGIKITPKAFGKDRRMPITNLYTFEKLPDKQ